MEDLNKTECPLCHKVGDLLQLGVVIPGGDHVDHPNLVWCSCGAVWFLDGDELIPVCRMDMVAGDGTHMMSNV